MSTINLQRALVTWVRLERRPGQEVIEERDVGNVHVVEFNMFDQAPPGATRADVHFVLVAPTEGLPDREEFARVLREAAGPGDFTTLSTEDLAKGPSYIALGGWLGSQDLALMLIGAAELVGYAKAITPEVLGITGEMADQLAGQGMVFLGPTA